MVHTTLGVRARANLHYGHIESQDRMDLKTGMTGKACEKVIDCRISKSAKACWCRLQVESQGPIDEDTIAPAHSEDSVDGALSLWFCINFPKQI